VAFDPAPIGPFEAPIESMRIAHHQLEGVGPEDVPMSVMAENGRVSFQLGAAEFAYDRFGLYRHRA
jgi:hypothetical protein